MRKENRGKFQLDGEILDAVLDNEIHQEDLTELLSNFLIIRAEYLLCNNTIEYWAYSELFEVVQPNEMVPIYKLLLEQENTPGEPSTLRLIGVQKL